MAATLDAMVGQATRATDEAPQNLCMDKVYDNGPSREPMRKQGYVAHTRRIGEEKLNEADEKRYPARRWVVERTLSWFPKYAG